MAARQPSTTMYRIAELERLTRELADRLCDLERLRPTCAVCLDATATRQTVQGPACPGCAGDPAEESRAGLAKATPADLLAGERTYRELATRSGGAP